MIISTTPTLEGHSITGYKGIVCGEVIVGAHLGKEFMAGLTNLVGGRSEAYESTFREARDGALSEMIRNAEKLGANAIVATKFDYGTTGGNGAMMLVAVSGTAITIG
jgi:uncharacterized protein YbjQ (UPF0145 family)